MKKIVYFLLFALCLPIGLMAQSAGDDLYFVPSKDKEQKNTPVKKEQKKQVTTNIYTSPGSTVVIQDRKGKTRDLDEYNRRYDARNNEFVMENDTLYIKEKAKPDLEGEWVTGEFNGTQDDYDYAERIIRFRNPRFAISISSPLYWDVVYGPNSWNWNVYTDGMYAYAFPTFSNPYWWDWRYGSYGYGWNYGWGWNRPYYSWGYYPGSWGGGYWGGWYGGGYWGSHWGHNHYYPSYGWGGGGGYYSGRSMINTNNRSRYSNGYTGTRRGTTSGYQGTSRRDGGVTTGRVVGTRANDRSDRYVESSRRGSSTYTRPSSTSTRSYRTTESDNRYSGGNSSSSRRSSSYSRGSSTESTRSYSGESTRRSSSTYSPSRSSSSSSYGSSSSGGSYRSSGGGNSSGGSSRSSGGGGGGSSRR